MMATKSKKSKSKSPKGRAAAPQKPAAKNGEPKKPAKVIANGSKAKAGRARSNGIKRVSALDAAARVLDKSGKPMRSRELISAMADQGLWTSPGGRTPWATLYSAMIREISTSGKDSRFKKVDRGAFAFNG